MNFCCFICPYCTVSVGSFQCFSCQAEFQYEKCDGLKVNCPLCINIPLDTYYQKEEDVDEHQKCWKNARRMFYECKCCCQFFCPCVEKQLKKKFELSMPMPRRHKCQGNTTNF